MSRVCPTCDGRMTRLAVRCRSCWEEECSSRTAIRRSCPVCGQHKSRAAFLCQACESERRIARSSPRRTCPYCEGSKSPAAAKCQSCRNFDRQVTDRVRSTCPDCGSSKQHRSSRCRPCASRHSRLWTTESCLGALMAWIGKHGRPPSLHDWNAGGYGFPPSGVVQERFGSWIAFLSAGGTSPGAGQRDPKRHDRFSPYWTKDRICELLNDWLVIHGRWPHKHDWMAADPDGRWPSAHTVHRVCGGWLRAHKAAGRPMNPGLVRRMTVHPGVKRPPLSSAESGYERRPR